MSSIRIGNFSIVTFVTALVLAVPAVAGIPANQKCEAGKNEAAGKYSACTAKAEKTLILKGDMAKYGTAMSKCESKLLARWEKLETVAAEAGTPCPSTADSAAIEDFVDACVQTMADSFAGAPLPSDVVTCHTDLADCSTSLSTTTAALGTCTADLSSTNADLLSCDAALEVCELERNALAGAPHWTCNLDYYDSNDGCDCGCGVVDPDCTSPSVGACNYCGDVGSCSPEPGCPGFIDPWNNAECQEYPTEWTCNGEYYAGNDGCDCGCGAFDPDCADATVASCDYCDNGGSCNTLACPGTIHPSNNAICGP